MSRTWSNNNKHNPYQKVYFKEYLSNINEPLDNPLQDTPRQLQAEMLGNMRDIQHGIRRMAKRLRRMAG